jgi:hypothetical protein
VTVASLLPAGQCIPGATATTDVQDEPVLTPVIDPKSTLGDSL